MQHHIIITGGIASGKTTLMAELATTLDTYRTSGLLTKAPERPHFSGAPAREYKLLEMQTDTLRPWASARPNGKGFQFDADTQFYIDHKLAPAISGTPPEILYLDEIGNLEMKDKGLHRVLNQARAVKIPLVICTVKKILLDQIQEKYNLQAALIVDLDLKPTRPAKEGILNHIRSIFGV